MKNLLKQIFRFGIVGIIAFIIDYTLLYIFTDILGINYLISSGLSFIISVIFNYVASIKYVFNTGHRQGLKDVIIFILLSTIGLGINEIIMFIGVNYLHVHYMIVKIGATAIVMVYNFITRKIFVEKK